MRKKIAWEWEELDGETKRARVIGGWIVNIHTRRDSGKTTTSDQSSVFVADRDHEWTLVKPVQEQESPPKSSVSEGY